MGILIDDLLAFSKMSASQLTRSPVDMSARVREVARELGEGEGRGRAIGVPTANLAEPPVLVPAHGVYACWAQLEGRSSPRLPAVANIGLRPTFGGERRAIEAHLLEGGGDLYGRNLRLEFIARLREERKFPGPEALVAQIRRDIEEGRRRLEALR